MKSPGRHFKRLKISWTIHGSVLLRVTAHLVCLHRISCPSSFLLNSHRSWTSVCQGLWNVVRAIYITSRTWWSFSLLKMINTQVRKIHGIPFKIWLLKLHLTSNLNCCLYNKLRVLRERKGMLCIPVDKYFDIKYVSGQLRTKLVSFQTSV